MSNPNESSGQGIRLPPISFLSNLNNQNPQPPSHTSHSTHSSHGLGISSLLTTDNDSFNNDSHLNKRPKLETDSSTSSLNLPAPILGIDRRKQNLDDLNSKHLIPPITHHHQSQQQHQQHQQQPARPQIARYFQEQSYPDSNPYNQMQHHSQQQIQLLPQHPQPQSQTPIQLQPQLHQQQQQQQQQLHQRDDLPNHHQHEQQQHNRHQHHHHHHHHAPIPHIHHGNHIHHVHHRALEDNSNQREILQVKQETADDNVKSAPEPSTESSQNIHSSSQENNGYNSNTAANQTYQKFVKPETTLDSTDVEDFIAQFPRKNLGTIIYNPTTTWTNIQIDLQLNEQDLERLQRKKENAINYYKDNNKTAPIIPLLPNLQNYINCLVNIKIPYRHIINRVEKIRNREIWGSEVYTDDSDILTILQHLGFWDNNQDLELTFNEEFTFQEMIIPSNLRKLGYDKELGIIDNDRVVGDLSVTLIILPPLNEYQGTFKYELNTRSWKDTKHDGMSIGIFDIQWEELQEFEMLPKYQKLKIREDSEILKEAIEKIKEIGGWKFDISAYRLVKDKISQDAKSSEEQKNKETEEEKVQG